MKVKFSFVVLLVLLVIRYLAVSWFFLQLDEETESLISAGFLFVTFMLILFSIWLNKGKLQELNVDKTSYWMLLGICSLLAWNLPFMLGLFMFVVVGYFIVQYQKNKIEFHTAIFSLRIFAIALCLFVPLLFLFAILKVDWTITTDQIKSALIKATFFGVVFEEYLFRGLLWGYLRSREVGENKILVIQAVLFWLAHYQLLLDGSLSFWTTVPFVGIILGLLALRSKSLTIGIVAHFFYNFLIGFIMK